MSKEPWHGKSVLIVDDSPTIRESLKAVFQHVGMRVIGVAENGVKGLEKMAESPADLVSLDLIMPEMDGIECFRKMRERYPEARLLVISWLGNEPKILANLKDQIPLELIQAKPVSSEGLRARLALVYGIAEPQALDVAPSIDIPGPVVEDTDFDALGVKIVS